MQHTVTAVDASAVKNHACAMVEIVHTDHSVAPESIHGSLSASCSL